MKPETLDRIERSLGFLVVLGIVMVMLGIAAIAEPFIATIAVTRVLSWTFLIAGLVRMTHAFRSRYQRGFWLKLLAGILYVLIGILLLSNIFGAKLTLTLAFGWGILVQGIFEVMAAFAARPAPNWGLLLSSGVVAIIIGILILYRWPFNAVWLVGLFTGISFIFTGAWMIMVPRAVRNHLSNS